MTVTTTIAITTTAAAAVIFNGDMGRDDRIREDGWNVVLRACLYGKEG